MSHISNLLAAFAKANVFVVFHVLDENTAELPQTVTYKAARSQIKLAKRRLHFLACSLPDRINRSPTNVLCTEGRKNLFY